MTRGAPRVIAPVQEHSPPGGSEAMAARCVIAHLSDLHFGNEDPLVLARLREDLLTPPLPDFLIVTGDLSERWKVRQLEDAKRYLDGILEELTRQGHDT